MSLRKLVERFGWFFTLAHTWMIVFLMFGLLSILIREVFVLYDNKLFSNFAFVLCSTEAFIITLILWIETLRDTLGTKGVAHDKRRALE